ncbi:MAG: hypothetical protein R3E65_11490 [Steroidobacteraceae bacterium]
MKAAWWILLLLPSPAFATWYEARTPNFIVLSDGSKRQAEDFARRLERFDRILRINTGNEDVQPGLPLRVVLRRNAREVQELAWWAGRDLVGFYTAGLRGPVAVVDRSPAQGDYDLSGEMVLYHEYVHHFMLQYTPFAYPVWYAEGYAEYYSTALFRSNGDVDLGRPPLARVPSLALEKWLPLQRLLTTTRADGDEREVRMLYAQGWLLTHMLSSDEAARRQLALYLRALGEGTAVEDAWSAAFGKSIAESDDDLRAYFERLKRTNGVSIRRYYAPKFETVALNVRELRDAEVASIELDVRLREDVRPEDRDPVWAEAQALVQRFPQDAYVLTLAAEAALATNRFADAAPLADRALAADPNAQRAMVVRGASRIEPLLDASDVDDSQVADARRWIVRANRLNPDDPMALLYNYLSYTVRMVEPSDNALQGLRVAHAVLPQSARVTLTLGSALLMRNLLPEARRVLSPLAYAPHAKGASAEARKMLESAATAQP